MLADNRPESGATNRRAKSKIFFKYHVYQTTKFLTGLEQFNQVTATTIVSRMWFWEDGWHFADLLSRQVFVGFPKYSGVCA